MKDCSIPPNATHCNHTSYLKNKLVLHVLLLVNAFFQFSGCIVVHHNVYFLNTMTSLRFTPEHNRRKTRRCTRILKTGTVIATMGRVLGTLFPNLRPPEGGAKKAWIRHFSFWLSLFFKCRKEKCHQALRSDYLIVRGQQRRVSLWNLFVLRESQGGHFRDCVRHTYERALSWRGEQRESTASEKSKKSLLSFRCRPGSRYRNMWRKCRRPKNVFSSFSSPRNISSH